VTMGHQHRYTKAGHSKPGNSSSFAGSPFFFASLTFHAFVYIPFFTPFFLCSVQVCATIFHAHGHKKATTSAAANYETGDFPGTPEMPPCHNP